MRRNVASFIFLWLTFSCAALPGQDSSEKDSRAKTVDQQPATVKPASQTRLRFGGFSVGGHWTSSPYWYPYYFPYAYAASYGWSPYWWGAYPAFYQTAYWMDASANSGKVKIECPRDDAELLIDGAYAGLLKDLKSISLAPGAYKLEIRLPDKKPYEKRIYVLTGKTVNITPVFDPLPEAIR